MIITSDGYIVNYKKRETLELVSGLNNTEIDGNIYTTKTLPKYLKVEDDSDIEKVIIKDFLKLINTSMSFRDIFNIGQEFNLSIYDIFISYIHINKDKYINILEQGTIDLEESQLVNQPNTEFINLLLLSVLTENLTTDLYDKTKIYVTIEDYELINSNISVEIINKVDKLILENKKNVEKYINTIFKISQITPHPYSEFITDEENINLVFDININLYTIFDNLVLSNMFPFCNFDKYIKVYDKLKIKKALSWNITDYSSMTINQLLQLAKENKIYIVRKNKKTTIIEKLKENDSKNKNISKDKLTIKYLIDKKYEKKRKY